MMRKVIDAVTGEELAGTPGAGLVYEAMEHDSVDAWLSPDGTWIYVPPREALHMRNEGLVVRRVKVETK
jgi:hypothetical protein